MLSTLAWPIGHKFNAIEIVGERTKVGKKWRYPAKCACGTQWLLWSHRIGPGRQQAKHCGCKSGRNKFGGQTFRRDTVEYKLYRVYYDMRSRCYNAKYKQFRDYGGRGITVCDEWRTDFAAFRDWALGPGGYKPGLTIDRRENDKGYSPDNCRWITKAEQARNKRTCRWVEAFGERKILTEWVEDSRCVVGFHTLRCRLNKGWSAEQAITMPTKDGLKTRIKKKLRITRKPLEALVHTTAKLGVEEVLTIFYSLESIRLLAKRYGVARTTAQNVRYARTWKWLLLPLLKQRSA